jgi:flagellar biosynthetic protein FlhB
MADEQEQGDKTFDPTPKKLEDALKRGDVVKSQEVNTWFVLMTGAMVILMLAGPVSTDITTTLKGLLANAHRIPGDGPGFSAMVRTLSLEIVTALALPLLLLTLAAIAGNMIQHQLVWSTDPLKPKLSKVSPIAGFKRLFGKTALVQFVKGLIKIAVVATAITLIVIAQWTQLEALVATDIMASLHLTEALALKILAAVVAIMFLVAAGDYVYQYYEWYERQRMSYREIREELKQTDGNPEIKAKIRQLRQARARKRMMAEVPKATVVIANPTHFAVALKYEPGMAAPICVAKGVDALALRIRALAEDNRVPVVENPPLARALHASVDLDGEIPAEHYKAVAEVIGFVLRMQRQPAWARRAAGPV